MIQLQKRVSWIQSAKRSSTAHKMDLVSFVTIWTENKITMIGSYVDSGEVSKIHFTTVSKIHEKLNTLLSKINIMGRKMVYISVFGMFVKIFE